MVRRLVTQDLCDDCHRHGIPDVPAVTEVFLAVNDGPRRRLQLCGRCQFIWHPFITLYEEQGQDDETAPADTSAKQSAKKSRTKTVKAAKAKELEKAPDEKPPTQHIICPEPHRSAKGGPLRIDYMNRNSHVDQCHPEKKIWDIEWGDPDEILKFPCTAHEACMTRTAKGLAFSTPQGLSSHKHSSPLPRIDEEDQQLEPTA